MGYGGDIIIERSTKRSVALLVKYSMCLYITTIDISYLVKWSYDPFQTYMRKRCCVFSVGGINLPCSELSLSKLSLTYQTGLNKRTFHCTARCLLTSPPSISTAVTKLHSLTSEGISINWSVLTNMALVYPLT